MVSVCRLCVSGIALTLRTGLELWVWRRSKVIRSLSRWTGSTSGTGSILNLFYRTTTLFSFSSLSLSMTPSVLPPQRAASSHLHWNQEHWRHLQLWWFPWIRHPSARFVLWNIVLAAPIAPPSGTYNNNNWLCVCEQPMRRSQTSSRRTGCSSTTRTNASRGWLSEGPSPHTWRQGRPDMLQWGESKQTFTDTGSGLGAPLVLKAAPSASQSKFNPHRNFNIRSPQPPLERQELGN